MPSENDYSNLKFNQPKNLLTITDPMKHKNQKNSRGSTYFRQILFKTKKFFSSFLRQILFKTNSDKKFKKIG